jgi:hypothetical protein
MRHWMAVAGAVLLLATGVTAGSQNVTPAEAAERLSGTWAFNRELSKGFSAPGARPGGPGRGGALFAAAPGPGQGGGGGGGQGGAAQTASDMTPEEIAAANAMRQLQQIADVLAIKATAERVTFADARGERAYAIDGKTARIVVGGADVSTKTRWDKAMLRQEFSTPQSKLTQTWEVDKDGRLVLVAKVESLRFRTPDQRAVFDRR